MTIRKRIWIIYMISIIVPVIIFGGSIYLFTTTVRHQVDEELENVRDMYVKDPIDTLIESLSDQIYENPKLLKEPSFEEFLSSAMQMTPFELTLKHNGETIIYIEQDRYHGDDILNVIRSGSFMDKRNRVYTYEVAIREREPKGGFIRRFNERVFQYGIVFVLIYGCLHLIFFKYALKTVFGPLEKMKDAAIRIRDEKYDEKIVYESQDEVGEVFHAFDEMRMRIKTSNEIQKQYEENRKELIANISHDLKTPITAINGYVQGILDGVANTDEKLNAYVETIAVYGRDMDTLINDLSLLSKLDLDGVLFQFENINIYNYMTDCLEELSFDLEEKGVEIKINLKIDPSVLVTIDPIQIKRVLNNIIFNAVKHFDTDSPLLEISVEEAIRGRFCEVRIRDNGIGISVDKLESIFERFYRVDVSRNSETGGSGLGLSISRQIIKAHGGSIWAESEVGVGTQIAFTIPKTREA